MTVYVPDVMVEIAFGSGYSTPAGSRTWMDVSAYVEPSSQIVITFGRGDELSTADANTLSLTLDNSDGRFTALRSASPYYPNVKIGTPIRVTTTPQGGAASVRFVGYIEEWPVEWDGSDEYATAPITASSRMARLGLDAELRSIVEETILLPGPALYYTLGEAKGAKAASDSSGNAGARAVQRGQGADVTFGVATGPGTDGLTALTLAGGKYLEGGIRSGGTASESSVVFFNRSGAPSTQENLFLGGPMTTLRMDTSGRIVGDAGTSPSGYADGATHCAVAVFELPNTFYLYVDGVLVATTNGGGGGSVRVRIGGPDSAGDTFNGVLAHAAAYDLALTSDQVSDIYKAGATGFAGESTVARFVRYASFGGIPTGEASANTPGGSTTVTHVDTTGSTVIDLLRRVEATEGGVMFDARDGSLRLQWRATRYAPSLTLTFDMAAQIVGADFTPKLDRTGLTNDVAAQNADGTVIAHVTDASSRDYYGVASSSLETMSDDDDEPYTAAAWRVAAFAEPKVRVPSLSVNLLDFTTAPSQDDVLAATIGTAVTVTGQPTQAATSSGSYFVEGYTETITSASYDLTFNVSPAEPWNKVVIFDDPTRGFDSGAIFAY